MSDAQESALTSSTPYSIRSVQRVLDILDLLQQAPGVSLGKVAEVTGLPKSSAFRYLSTLESRRYVERDPYTGDYRLGLAFLPFQARHLETITERARPYMETLRDRLEETINLGLLDGKRVIYLEILESPKAMRLAPRPGDREHIHSTALGKAIAAHLDEEEVLAILAAEGMPRRTPRTIVDPDEFLEGLQEVRDCGYAMDNRENEAEGRCLAVPLFAGRLPVALSLSAPASRFPLDHIAEVAEELRNAAMQLAQDLNGGD